MPKQTTSKKTLSKMLEELEEIVDTMESEQIDLEKSLKFFEQGIGLIKECQKSLSAAEQKVKQLTAGKLKDFEVEE